MLTTLDIKAELTRRGYTLASLARELGYHKSTVTRVINGDYPPYPRVMAALERIIGVPVGELAPGRATPLSTEHIAHGPIRSTQKESGISAQAGAKNDSSGSDGTGDTTAEPTAEGAPRTRAAAGRVF